MTEKPHVRSLLRMAGGALIGLPIAVVLVETGAVDAVAAWRTEEIVSTALAAALLLVAGITGTAATSRRGYRALTDEGLGEPVETGMLSLLRRQALVTGLLGLFLLIPPAAAHAGFTGAAAVAPIIALLAELAALAWLQITLNRDGDELTRAVSIQSGSASFVAAGLMLFGWAALEKLALLPAVDSWTMMTAMMVVSLIVSTIISVRRGLIGR